MESEKLCKRTKRFSNSAEGQVLENELRESGSPEPGQESRNKVHVARTKALSDCRIGREGREQKVRAKNECGQEHTRKSRASSHLWHFSAEPNCALIYSPGFYAAFLVNLNLDLHNCPSFCYDSHFRNEKIKFQRGPQVTRAGCLPRTCLIQSLCSGYEPSLNHPTDREC